MTNKQIPLINISNAASEIVHALLAGGQLHRDKESKDEALRVTIDILSAHLRAAYVRNSMVSDYKDID